MRPAFYSGGLAVVALVTLFASTSWAQQAPAPKKKPSGPTDKTGNPLGRLVMLHDLEATRQSNIARDRMKANDCQHALDSFDAALKGSNDPTLRRDRGICHETLGQPTPAIDDYRAYLTALPEAQDAPAIRERLDRLRGETGQGGEPDREEPKSSSGAKASAGFSLKANGAGVSGSASADTQDDVKGPEKGTGGKDAAVILERKEAADALNLESDTSALRRGTGPVLGVVGGPRWFIRDSGTESGYIIAGTLRLSVSRITTVLVDVGYTGQATDSTRDTVGGLTAMLGVEARLPLNKHVTNAFLIGAGLGYERIKFQASGAVSSIFMPRGRFGFRHVFGPSFGLEVTVDGGYGIATDLDSSATSNVIAIGPNVGLVSAF